jgi:hypothetical protein
MLVGRQPGRGLQQGFTLRNSVRLWRGVVVALVLSDTEVAPPLPEKVWTCSQVA